MRPHAAIVLIALSGASMLANGGVHSSDHVIASYSITIPDGYVLRDISPPMMDFYLFKVYKKSSKTGCLKIYFGNNPGFPTMAWKDKGKEGQEGGRTFSSHPFDPKTGRMEGLIQHKNLKDSEGAPSPFSRVHYFSDGKISQNDAMVYDQIIGSIRVTDPSWK